MSSEWRTRTVEDLISGGVLAPPIDGNHGGIHPKSSDFVDAGIPFIMASDMKNGRVDTENCAFITAQQAATLRKGFAKTGDVLLSHKATIGRTALVEKIDTDFLVLTPQVTYYRVIDPNQLNNRYLKYYFDSAPFQQTLASWSGAGSTRAYLGITAQRKLPVVLPPIEIQNEVALTAGGLDDRISVLRETNATLEAIAQALFKSWFVDFDPVRAKLDGRAPEGMDETTAALFPDVFEESGLGPVPKGWQVKALTDAFEVNPKRSRKKGLTAPYLEMASIATSGHCVEPPTPREVGSGAKFCNGDTLLARITPCLENGKSAFVDFLSDGQIGWGSTEFVVLRPKAPLPEYFGYLLCRHQAFRDYAINSMSGTSGRQRIQNDVLGRYLLALPDEAIASVFGEVIEPIQRSIAANHQTVQILATLRDTLLPRLISGHLRLADAPTLTESATA